MMFKDYYRTLGVIDDAEDIVIKAAYKALAQRYHPDKWAGDKTEANRRMTEINEAYGVLSDPVKRKEYDSERDQATFQAEPEADDLNSSVEADWNKVIEYFPDLVGIAAGLAKLSPSLAYSYKVMLLDTKNFNGRQALANSLEEHYLEKYFGSNKDIKQFAKILISTGTRIAAKELNDAVTLLGSNVSSTVIIDRIQKKFDLGGGFFSIQASVEILMARSNYKYSSGDLAAAKQILDTLGYEYRYQWFSQLFYVTDGIATHILHEGGLVNFSREIGQKYLRGEQSKP